MRSSAAGDGALLTGPAVHERVRWSDLDMMGVVYFGRYLRFMEAAETEFFRALGFTYAALADEHGVWFARVRFTSDYRAPARLDDDIVCRAELTRAGGASLAFAFPVDRADGTRLVDGTLVIAAVDRITLRPTAIPGPLRAALGAPPAQRH